MGMLASPSGPRVPAGFSRRTVLVVGIAMNLALLAFFKYFDFFIENLNFFAGTSFRFLHVVLPLGISFFTFTQIAFLVDSYRGEAKEYNLTNYALFVTFFPHLIAGPILHHKEMMTQFASRWTWAISYRNIFMGLYIFSIGLFKKVVLADTFAIWANGGFRPGMTHYFFSAWATSLSYTFQLYFDFSGYCDMAIGAALLFNIWLPINFNSPYKALDIQDFWRRWHITLSRYLRNYLYIPLGGNRCGPIRVYFNLMATFILGGLWHGASWMFVVWGALHGAALVVHRIWKNFGMSMPSPLAWFVTFMFANITWVFFRAQTSSDAKRILLSMIDVGSIFNTPVDSIPPNYLAWEGVLFDRLTAVLPVGFAGYILCYAMIAIGFVIVFMKNSIELTLEKENGWPKVAGMTALFSAGLSASAVSTTAVFLYFNF
jgi:D-alanyl-lipoteichoic acid acyltransferase DltB (MBOAT superfamily)